MQVRGQSEPRSTDLADTAAVEAGRGQITVRGTITVPDPCHTELRVSGSASGRELTVRLQARDAGGMCAQVLSAVDYRAATAEPVPPGRWVVRVFHSGADSGGRAALDTVRVRPPD